MQCRIPLYPLVFLTSMLYQIASFLLDVIGGLLTGACLLRLYMQWQRIPFSNPVGGLVFALTDWLIMPLRRVIPPVGRWDVSSLVAAVLLQLVQYFLLTLLLHDELGAHQGASQPVQPERAAGAWHNPAYRPATPLRR